MPLVDVLLLALAAVGHFMLCVAVINRMRALVVPPWAIAALTVSVWASLLLMPWGLFWNSPNTSIAVIERGNWLPLVYLAPCWMAVAWTMFGWLRRWMTRHDQAVHLVSNHTTSVDLVGLFGRRPVADLQSDVLTRIPGNQFLDLRLHEKAIEIPRLPAELSGLKIAHLSDWHMSGRVEKDWFVEIVRLANEAQPDLVAITGDLFDRNVCLDWIGDTFAKLQAPGGVFFVLGNHDLRVDHARARRLLTDAGLVDLGGRWREIEYRGAPILLAGNELPWFTPAADMEHCPTGDSPRPFRLLLSHAPDQFDWARRWDFDLMLAGHTHGGQIRLPLLGPILSPSLYGVHYSSGTFYHDPTVMHVSRGLSSLTPLRWNCPPELAILELRTTARA